MAFYLVPRYPDALGVKGQRLAEYEDRTHAPGLSEESSGICEL